MQQSWFSSGCGWVVVALLTGCAKKVETSALSQADEIAEDKAPEAFFAACTEKAEMKGGNHYKVFDCGAQRASYYDSPGKMSFEEVITPISSEARSLGYQVFPSDGTMKIKTVPAPVAADVGASDGSAAPPPEAAPTVVELPVKYLTHKTPPAVGAETKFTLAVTLQPLEGERTRVHDCKIPAATDDAQYQTAVAWCNAAFDEMFSYEKSAEDALLEMKQAEMKAIEDAEGAGSGSAPKKPTTVIIDDN
jgi:hypothetical protein